MNIEKILNDLTNEQKAQLVSGVDNWYTASVESLNIPEIMMAINVPLKGVIALGAPDDLIDQFIQDANKKFSH